MDRKRYKKGNYMIRKLFLPIAVAIIAVAAQAQETYNVHLTKEATDAKHIHVTQIKNNRNESIEVILKNDDGNNATYKLDAGGIEPCDKICTAVEVNIVSKAGLVAKQSIWGTRDTKKLWDKQNKDESAKLETLSVNEDEQAETKGATIDIDKPRLPNGRRNLSSEQILKKFTDYVNQISFLSDAGLAESKSKIDEYIKNLQNWENIDSCIIENNLQEYVRQNMDSLDAYKQEAQSLIYRFSKRFNADEATNAEISQMLNDRIAQREEDLDRLQTAMNAGKASEDADSFKMDKKTIANCGIILFIVLLVIIWIIIASKKKSRDKLQRYKSQGTSAAPGIVVRRTTTSILKKQSLEDVIDNPAYLKIDCADFCNDSAVRRIYLKNTCVKDIYNMYAEDLRNPDNPKEDGCMVLGRWVHDKEANEYYVSLEHIVLPGDDAVFSEYELNFGGKIKLRVAEKLRKLRRETNLQYDMTCWVHSHPGLGVFFSNADNTAHIQMKHPTHPYFLTAMVVDILTPEQELGIFTFKKDGTVNAKSDLTKMYSLESLYKWAVESDRNAVKVDDKFNSLAKAQKHYYDCVEVLLSNGAIIDMGMLATEQENGALCFVHGFADKQGAKTRFIAATTSKQEAVPDNDLIGCFVTATHCSIPSIKKAVAGYLGRINFVIVSSTSDGLLTTIPVVNGELCNDTNYYGEENFEELKIWTRRKR